MNNARINLIFMTQKWMTYICFWMSRWCWDVLQNFSEYRDIWKLQWVQEVTVACFSHHSAFATIDVLFRIEVILCRMKETLIYHKSMFCLQKWLILIFIRTRMFLNMIIFADFINSIFYTSFSKTVNHCTSRCFESDKKYNLWWNWMKTDTSLWLILSQQLCYIIKIKTSTSCSKSYETSAISTVLSSRLSSSISAKFALRMMNSCSLTFVQCLKFSFCSSSRSRILIESSMIELLIFAGKQKLCQRSSFRSRRHLLILRHCSQRIVFWLSSCSREFRVASTVERRSSRISSIWSELCL